MKLKVCVVTFSLLLAIHGTVTIYFSQVAQVTNFFQDYWRPSLLRSNFCQSMMSRYRFMKILRSVHFVDNHEAMSSGVGNPDSPNYDRLYKVRKMVDTTLSRFSEYRQADRSICIDEQMVAFMGRSKWCQCVPSKPRPIGIKLCQLSNYVAQWWLCGFSVSNFFASFMMTVDSISFRSEEIDRVAEHSRIDRLQNIDHSRTKHCFL